MTNESPLGKLSAMSSAKLGVFRGAGAVDLGITRKQLLHLQRTGVIEREYPDTYRLTAVRRCNEQRLRLALEWAGPEAAGADRSAGEVYGFEGVHTTEPEIVVPPGGRQRRDGIVVHRTGDRDALMLRSHRGITVTGPEATLVALGASLAAEAFEIACEDARRRRLTSIPALRAYLDRFGRAGRPGVAAVRRLLHELDPVHPSRSKLEVKTRRLLAANGIAGFVREFPLGWDGRTYLFDFGFVRGHTILETNGRRWHDDVADYEYDNEKWSVPGRHGYRLVLATWTKVTEHPGLLLRELAATLAA